MPDQDDRLAHLLVLAHVEDREFTRRGGGDPKVRDVERRAHGQRLQSEASAAVAQQDQSRTEVGLAELAALGVVVTIEGSGGEAYPLKLDSLEQLTTHQAGPLPKWLLLSVSPATNDQPERASVWVSDHYRGAFLKLFEDYLTKASRKGRPRNRELVANIARIRVTVLRDL